MCSPMNCLLLILILGFSPVPSEARTFRFAIALYGDLCDFGWTFHQNIARITLQNKLMHRHPDINTSHELAFIPESYTEYCDPQFDAWCKAGMDLIITGPGHQYCATRLARSYPNVTFLAAAGSISGPPNYANALVRSHQVYYLAGYTAGLMTATKKVCISVPILIPASIITVTGFFRGIHSADPTVEIHVFSTGKPYAALLEVWIVNQSHALGCDVVYVMSSEVDGMEQASQLGMMSIGTLADSRLTIGESVITSAIIDMAPAYLRAAEAVLNGTFANETQKADWWMGWNGGVMLLADFSFLVPKAVQNRVLAQVPALDRVFCGRVCTKKQCLCNASTCCLTDDQLNAIDPADPYPDFILDHGVMQLPGQACPAGKVMVWHLDTFTMECSDCPAGMYAYNVDQISECRPCPAATYSSRGATNCTACPAGTYNAQPGQGHCTLCPAGSVAPNIESMHCSECSSAISSSDRTQCESPSLMWIAGVGGGVAGGLVLLGACLLWLVRRHGRRNNRAAPKDASQPFCIVFTDIQGSTSLWAAIPDVMAVALDTHHALIRGLIAKHHCYEVKTIGDSFMCAVKSPAHALQFALALQEEFVRHDWGTDRLDKVYAELTAPKTATPGCWNGLRVRAGIHYGQGDIKLDPVSHGYDYYGTVVNTAARIESVCHGGQTGASEAVFQAVGGHCPGAVWADLGPQPLRGLSEPLRLYQLLPEGALSQRRFPPLRIDHKDVKEEALAEGEAHVATTLAVYSTNNRSSVAPSTSSSCIGPGGRWADTHPLVTKGTVSASDLRRFYNVLQVGLATLLTPLAHGMKQEVMKELCTLFHVPNLGCDGVQLLRTLDGLVKRVLPATVLHHSEPKSNPHGPFLDVSTIASHKTMPLNSWPVIPSPVLQPSNSNQALSTPRSGSTTDTFIRSNTSQC